MRRSIILLSTLLAVFPAISGKNSAESAEAEGVVADLCREDILSARQRALQIKAARELVPFLACHIGIIKLIVHAVLQSDTHATAVIGFQSSKIKKLSKF